MAIALPVHPLRKWREDRGYRAEDVSALITARGFTLKPRSILAVEDGWRRPAYNLCEVIESITGKAVTISDLRHWPLRPGAGKSAA